MKLSLKSSEGHTRKHIKQLQDAGYQFTLKIFGDVGHGGIKVSIKERADMNVTIHEFGKENAENIFLIHPSVVRKFCGKGAEWLWYGKGQY